MTCTLLFPCLWKVSSFGNHAVSTLWEDLLQIHLHQNCSNRVCMGICARVYIHHLYPFNTWYVRVVGYFVPSFFLGFFVCFFCCNRNMSVFQYHLQLLYGILSEGLKGRLGLYILTGQLHGTSAHLLCWCMEICMVWYSYICMYANTQQTSIYFEHGLGMHKNALHESCGNGLVQHDMPHTSLANKQGQYITEHE